MRKEYNFSKGVRGKHAGQSFRIVGDARKKNLQTADPVVQDELAEALKLLSRARTHLKDTQRAEQLKEKINEFLDRVKA